MGAAAAVVGRRARSVHGAEVDFRKTQRRKAAEDGAIVRRPHREMRRRGLAAEIPVLPACRLATAREIRGGDGRFAHGTTHRMRRRCRRIAFAGALVGLAAGVSINAGTACHARSKKKEKGARIEPESNALSSRHSKREGWLRRRCEAPGWARPPQPSRRYPPWSGTPSGTEVGIIVRCNRRQRTTMTASRFSGYARVMQVVCDPAVGGGDGGLHGG